MESLHKRTNIPLPIPVHNSPHRRRLRTLLHNIHNTILLIHVPNIHRKQKSPKKHSSNRNTKPTIRLDCHRMDSSTHMGSNQKLTINNNEIGDKSVCKDLIYMADKNKCKI